MKRKIVSILCGVLLCTGLISPTYAYSRTDAISYADQYALSRNSIYNHYSSDCTNFVSQCMRAGGFPMDAVWWWEIRTTSSSYVIRESQTWRVSNDLKNYFTTYSQASIIGSWARHSSNSPSGYAYVANSSNLTASNTGKVVIFYDWTGDGKIDHASFYVANNSAGSDSATGDLIDQHTTNRKRVVWHLDQYNTHRETTKVYAYELSV